MKKRILAIMILLILTSLISLYAQWAKTYGGTGDDSAYSIKQTSDGGYIVVGETSSFGAGESDIWALKLSPDGEIEWQKTYGGIEDDSASSIQQTGDGGYIVSGTTNSFGAGYSNIWVLKLSSAGDIDWQKTYGGSNNDNASSIQQTSDGGYIVAGHIESSIHDPHFWISKLSSAGDIDWQNTYGGYGSDSVSSIQQTSDGGYIVAGCFQSWSGVAGCGGFWILKLSSAGDIEWQKRYGGSQGEFARSIQQTIDGGYIAAGSVGDIRIIKLNSIGDIEWQYSYGGDDGDHVQSIHQTSDGGYIIAGETESFGVGESDIWALKLSPDGDIEWQKTYGGCGSDSASSIQQTSDGGYIVAGYTISWGEGSKDFWVLKLSSDGDINPRCSFIRNSNAEVSNTDISPELALAAQRDEDITPQDTNITPQDTDATVYNLCSEKPLLCILTSDGGTTVPTPGTYIHEPGTEVTITAFPEDGRYFRGWCGDASGETSPITIIMDSDKSIRADFGHEWGGGDGEDKISLGGGCFIATAAYGSMLHPCVKILRDFRDKYLLPCKLGRKIVDFYYRYSPFVANIISKHKALKVMAQINLLPIIAIGYSILHLGPIITTALLFFIFILPAFFIWRYQRKLRRHIREKK